MTSIITTSQLQKQIGKISEAISTKAFIVTNNGEGRIVMLPYFDGCDDNIADYLEDYEMRKNKDKLVSEFNASIGSGKSDLSV